MSKNKSFRAALIGVGRLGHPFKKYISKMPAWDLVVSNRIPDRLGEFDYLFLATPDTAISALADNALKLNPKIKTVHFSGSVFHEKSYGVHPVFSFPKSKFIEIDFKSINYVVDHTQFPFELKSIFPKRHFIKPELKPCYHSFLSLTANYTQLLSQHYGSEFKKDTGLSPSLLKGLMLQSLENEIKLGPKSFSGPWVRGEKKNQDKLVKKIKSKSLDLLNSNFKKLIKSYESVINNKALK